MSFGVKEMEVEVERCSLRLRGCSFRHIKYAYSLVQNRFYSYKLSGRTLKFISQFTRLQVKLILSFLASRSYKSINRSTFVSFLSV